MTAPTQLQILTAQLDYVTKGKSAAAANKVLQDMRYETDQANAQKQMDELTTKINALQE